MADKQLNPTLLSIIITHSTSWDNTWYVESRHRPVGFCTAYFHITTEDVWLSAIPILRLPPGNCTHKAKHLVLFSLHTFNEHQIGRHCVCCKWKQFKQYPYNSLIAKVMPLDLLARKANAPKYFEVYYQCFHRKINEWRHKCVTLPLHL